MQFITEPTLTPPPIVPHPPERSCSHSVQCSSKRPLVVLKPEAVGGFHANQNFHVRGFDWWYDRISVGPYAIFFRKDQAGTQWNAREDGFVGHTREVPPNGSSTMPSRLHRWVRCYMRRILICRSETELSQGRYSRRDTTSLIKLELLGRSHWGAKVSSRLLKDSRIRWIA